MSRLELGGTADVTKSDVPDIPDEYDNTMIRSSVA